MENAKFTTSRSVSFPNNDIVKIAYRIKKILIAYMLILNLDNLLIYLLEIIFKNTIMIFYILITAVFILILWSEIRNFSNTYIAHVKNLNCLLMFAFIVFCYCNFSIFYVFWYQIMNNESEYQRVYFKEEISTYRNIHTFCLLLFAILNLFFNIWTFLSLLTLKRFSIKTQVEYTQGSSNYSIDARSQLGNIQILDMA